MGANRFVFRVQTQQGIQSSTLRLMLATMVLFNVSVGGGVGLYNQERGLCQSEVRYSHTDLIGEYKYC